MTPQQVQTQVGEPGADLGTRTPGRAAVRPRGRTGTVRLDMEVEGDEVRIDVADDGIGLPEEVAISGGGFGLNTVRNLTRQIRGRLEIERLTPGTRFLLTFPMKPGSPTQA